MKDRRAIYLKRLIRQQKFLVLDTITVDSATFNHKKLSIIDSDVQILVRKLNDKETQLMDLTEKSSLSPAARAEWLEFEKELKIKQRSESFVS